MDNIPSRLCERIAIVRELEDHKFPQRKMGRQVASWSFNSILEKKSTLPVEYLKPRFPFQNIRNGILEKEALFIGDPNLVPYSEERLWDRPERFSIVGITHTLSTPGPLDFIPKVVHAPIFPWDALICTSKSAKDAINVLWNNQEQILIARGGVAPSRPQLPIIPLGISSDSFKHKYSRDEARNKLQINAEDNVVLWTGRLEVHCKAHHSSTFRSVQIASEISDSKKWILLMYGTSIMPNIKEALKEAAAYLCSSVEVRILDGHDIELGNIARSASDFFISLADSYQETFGLTPIEAMAAELPVVASNWNGYRESIINDKTGFLVDTKVYKPGLKNKRLQQILRQEKDLDYISAIVGSQVNVDVKQAGSALAKLANSKLRARAMGSIGAQRVRSIYDWDVILKSYLNLLELLKEERTKYGSTDSNCNFHSIPPISKIFQSWPSHTLNMNTKFTRCNTSLNLSRTLNLNISKFYADASPSFDLLKEVYENFEIDEPISGNSILDKMKSDDLLIHPILMSIGWLNKHGFLQESPE